MIWMKKRGLHKGNLVSLEGNNNISSKKTEENLIPYLKDIFYKKKHAQYIGATLCFYTINKKYILISINNSKNEEEKYWLCMNYFKYKSEESIMYHYAEEYLFSRKDKELEIAKLFLDKGVN